MCEKSGHGAFIFLEGGRCHRAGARTQPLFEVTFDALGIQRFPRKGFVNITDHPAGLAFRQTHFTGLLKLIRQFLRHLSVGRFRAPLSPTSVWKGEASKPVVASRFFAKRGHEVATIVATSEDVNDVTDVYFPEETPTFRSRNSFRGFESHSFRHFHPAGCAAGIYLPEYASAWHCLREQRHLPPREHACIWRSFHLRKVS